VSALLHLTHRSFHQPPYTEATVEILDIPQVRDRPEVQSANEKTARARLRLAYLLSRYPAISHTFFLHEVLGMRARGLHIETASVNEPDRALEALPAEEAAEAQHTFYLKAGGAGALLTLVSILVQHPRVLLRGLRALFRLRQMTLRERFFSFFYLAEAMLLGRWMREQRLTHLHVHFGGAVAMVGMLAASAWNIPYSLTIHGPEELLDVSAYHLRDKLMAAAFIVCISDFCRSQLCRLLPPEEWAKLHVVRLGVDPMLLQPPVRPSLPLDPIRPFELVCTGRLVPDKGQSVLLQALALLHGRGIPLHATLIGGGVDEARLKLLARELGIANDVRFTSALSHADTLACLRRADIFALPSFAEGVPVALMEAMSLGIPCVSTSIAGIPELIRTGRDGLLVAPGDTLALADALEALLKDQALRRSLAASGRQRVIECYNLPLNQELLAGVFANCIQTKHGTAEGTR
jgi:colanic acid/amylovoran biosynthesis glycosyltransferase